MESNYELKEIHIKNRTCYYFDGKIKTEDFCLDNILLDNILTFIIVYNNSYKSLISAKPLHVRFDKIDGFIRVYDETRYLVLLGSEKI